MSDLSTTFSQGDLDPDACYADPAKDAAAHRHPRNAAEQAELEQDLRLLAARAQPPYPPYDGPTMGPAEGIPYAPGERGEGQRKTRTTRSWTRSTSDDGAKRKGKARDRTSRSSAIRAIHLPHPGSLTALCPGATRSASRPAGDRGASAEEKDAWARWTSATAAPPRADRRHQDPEALATDRGERIAHIELSGQPPRE